MFFNIVHVPDDVKVSYLTTPIVYLVRSESQCARKLQDQKANSLCIFYKSSTISTDDVKELFEELQHEKVIRIKSIPVDFTVNCPVCWNKKGPSGESNSGPLAPKARIIPLDHKAAV